MKHSTSQGRLVPWLLIAVALWSFVFMPAAQAAGLTKIPAGSGVTVALTTQLNSDQLSPGMTVPLQVVADVVIDGQVVIAAGAPGTATVTALQKSNFAGIPGKLTLTALSVTAADGGQVPLTGLTYSEGENKMVVSIALAFVCLLTLLIKGGPAMPPVGTQFNTTVALPVEITVS